MKKISDAIRTSESNIHLFQEMYENMEDTFIKTGYAAWDNDCLTFHFKSDWSFGKRIFRRIQNLKKTLETGLMTLETTREIMEEYKQSSLHPARKVLTEKTGQPSDIPISYEELISEKEQEDLETAMYELCLILTSDNSHRREEERMDICSHILTLYECGLYYGHRKTIRMIERFVR